MGQNYNLNSSFGFNIMPGAKNASAKGALGSEASKNAFGSVFNFVDKYENVFNGDVEKEINMYSRQAMFVGMNLKAGDNNIRRFDVNI